MPFPSVSFRSELDPVVRKELDADFQALTEFLSKEHHPDGTHADITADSILCNGDLQVLGNTYFEALIGTDITANSLTADNITCDNITVNGLLSVASPFSGDGGFGAQLNSPTDLTLSGNTSAATTASFFFADLTTGLNDILLQCGLIKKAEFNVALSADSGTNAFAGGLTIVSDLAVDTDTLFVDESADRVGINTSSPSYDLHVAGTRLYLESANNLEFGAIYTGGARTTIQSLSTVGRTGTQSNHDSEYVRNNVPMIALGASDVVINNFNVRMSHYGAGVAVFDGSGNISSDSATYLKDNGVGNSFQFVDTLANVRTLTVVGGQVTVYA